MGLINKLKKKIELKQHPIDSTYEKGLEKLPKLENALKKNPSSYDLLFELYGCYIDLSNTKKKIECLEKMSELKPQDLFPLNQLAQIYYGDLNDPVKGKYYQDMANKINSNKFL